MVQYYNPIEAHPWTPKAKISPPNALIVVLLLVCKSHKSSISVVSTPCCPRTYQNVFLLM
jgi:hypothetical protein